MTIVIDQREKHPYTFGPNGPRVATARLAAGDYSVAGLEHLVAIERKETLDLYATVAQRRWAFQRALARMASMGLAAVVVEATWRDLMRRPPEGVTLSPAVVRHFCLEWRRRFPAVRWHFVPGRREGELLTLALLQQFWCRHQQPKESTPCFETTPAPTLPADGS